MSSILHLREVTDRERLQVKSMKLIVVRIDSNLGAVKSEELRPAYAEGRLPSRVAKSLELR